jgi:hypothetical protein
VVRYGPGRKAGPAGEFVCGRAAHAEKTPDLADADKYPASRKIMRVAFCLLRLPFGMRSGGKLALALLGSCAVTC